MITKQEIRKQITHRDGTVCSELDELIDDFNEYELCDRRNFAGHITVGCVIVEIASRKILLLHHKTYQKWHIPGGHIDYDAKSLHIAMLQKIEEETGIPANELIPVHTDKGVQYCTEINTHRVFANDETGELEHLHHDFRFVFGYKGDGYLRIDDNKSSDYKWVAIDDPEVRHTIQYHHIDTIIVEELEQYEEQVRITKGNDYFVTPIARYQLLVANSLFRRNETEAAERMYKSAIKSFEHTYSEEYETPPDILSALWNLSLLYSRSGRHDLTVGTLEKGLEFCEMYCSWDDNFTDQRSEFRQALKNAQNHR